MAKAKGVSGKTHTQQQLNHYANQKVTQNKAKEEARKKYDWGILDGESYGWCDD